MKRSITILIIFLLFNTVFANQITNRIERYAGDNAQELINLYENGNEYQRFILENCSINDLSSLTEDYLQKNLEFALKTQELPFTKDYDKEIFNHFVLPYRVSQEPLQDYREQFYNDLLPLIKDETDIEKAIIKVNLWVTEQHTFVQTHGRDQAPLTTIKRGFGRCEESMILFIAAARSVGIPCKTASVPYWNFSDSNHAWVEVWTPEGWKYVGEVENSLNRTWFSKTTERATIVTSRAFGNYDSPDVIRQKNNTTLLNSTKNYREPTTCVFKVKDEKNNPVAEAKINLYATSFGGLFAMQSFTANEAGEFEVDLGASSVWVTAAYDGKFGHKLFNIMEDNVCEITLSDNKKLDEQFTILFPLQNDRANPNQKKELLGESFYDMRQIRHLKRKNRLMNQMHGKKFARFYDEFYFNEQDGYFAEREDFMEKCDKLAGNSELYLQTFAELDNSQKKKMLVDIIKNWDIKELSEVPDSTAIHAILDIYQDAKNRFDNTVTDSMFIQNILSFTWRSFTPPQNGWQTEFYHEIEPLATSEIESTTQNVLQWIDENLEVEENQSWSYFSGTLNPMQILNMKYVSPSYRMKALNCALKLLGVPVRYKRILEYYNGSGWQILEAPQEKSEELTDKEILVKMLVDGEEVSPKPWENFLIASMSDDGNISYTYFEPKEDNKFIYKQKPQENIYLETFVRNGNGDANVIIKSINGLSEVNLNLQTPKEFIDKSERWNEQEITKLKKQLPNKKRYQLAMVVGKNSNEPEVRTFDQIISKAEHFNQKDFELTVVSDSRSNLKENRISALDNQIFKKLKFTLSNVNENEFPVLLLFDEDKLIFSSIGYDMGLAKLILKKMK